MTIVKHETIEFTREEFTTIKKCIKLMMTAKKDAGDPVLKDEAHKIALALEQFRHNFTVHMAKEEEGEGDIEDMEESDDYIAGFHEGYANGIAYAENNPPIRANY